MVKRFSNDNSDYDDYDRGGGRDGKRRKTNDGGRRSFSEDQRDRAECNVFVGNLKYETKWQALKDHMRRAGNVDSANILTDHKTGRSKGCGIVTYQNARDAKRAIQELNESSLEGRTIFVQEDSDARSSGTNRRDHAPRDRAPPPSSGTSVFVGNLSFDCSWQNLKDLFKKFGRVEHSEIPEGPNGRKRGYGLIRFSDPRDARDAIHELDGTSFQGRNLEVRVDRDSRSEPPRGSGRGRDPPAGVAGEATRTKRSKGQQIYVGNLSFDCTWQELKDLFKKFGKVDHAEVVETSTGKKTGFGIVKFAHASDANKAIDRLDGSDFQGRRLAVRWDERPERLENDSKNDSKPTPTKKPKPQKREQKKKEDTAMEIPSSGERLASALSSSR